MGRVVESQWFFDTGDGFLESASIRVSSGIDAEGRISQSVSVPAGCRHLRWDPCEQPSVVNDPVFTADGGRRLMPTPISGIATGDGFVFYSHDPQFIIGFDTAPDQTIKVDVSAEFHFIEEGHIARAFRYIDESAAHERQKREKQRIRRKIRQLLDAMLSRRERGGGAYGRAAEGGPYGRPGEGGPNGRPAEGGPCGGPEADDYLSAEARRIVRQMMDPYEKNRLFVPYRGHSISFKDGDVKPIAFYLPQYHAIPENDEWWGKGFTEWYSVAGAAPSFDGHYQPQLPYDVGFYDLSHTDVMKRQIELARNYGVYGFCFYYYRFGEKRLLERPLENYLRDSEGLDFPFCVCWANENWTRRWDGNDEEVLLGQSYTEQGGLSLIKDMARYFADSRYIRIDGKPLMVVYRGNLVPNLPDMLASWRGYCRSVGIGEIVVAGNAMAGIEDPVSFGFDFGIDFTPNSIMESLGVQVRETLLSPSKREYHLYDMQPFIDGLEGYLERKADMLYTVFPAWDNTARRKTEAHIYPLSAGQYRQWLEKCIGATAANQSPGKRFVFINAWNEWAEGAHLEPDRMHGYANLEATAEAVGGGR